MAIEITMPRLSDTMEQGTVVSWNVKEGDAVSAGDVLGDIETDKATMELQCFDDGVVAGIMLGEGETVSVGSLIMVLAEEDEDAGAVKSQFAGRGAAAATAPVVAVAAGGSTVVAEPPAQTASGTGAVITNGAAGGGGRVFASPLAKKIAAEQGIDLRGVTGTGPSGRVVKKDVEGAPRVERGVAASPVATRGLPVTAIESGGGSGMMMESPGGLVAQTVALNNMRRTIATRLVQSKQTVPHYQVTVTARMDALLDLRKRLNEQLGGQGVKLSVNDFLVRACALAMHQHPFVNASWGEDGASIVQHGAVNVGVAVALSEERGGGLVVATLHDADRMGLRQISTRTKEMAGKARERGLSIEEMEGSTFTISNLGMFGVEHFTAIINPPNSAILAVGAAVKKPVVEGDEIVVGHEMQMTMSSDHRVIDGAMAAAYLKTVREMLEAPATLLV